MKAAYKFLSKNLPFILFGSIITPIVGVAAMKLGYNSTTSWLKLTGACTILYVILALFNIGYSIFISYKMPSAVLTKINQKFIEISLL